MTQPTDTDRPLQGLKKGQKREEREARSARALRENLRRRKAQLKAREDDSENFDTED